MIIILGHASTALAAWLLRPADFESWTHSLPPTHLANPLPQFPSVTWHVRHRSSFADCSSSVYLQLIIAMPTRGTRRLVVRRMLRNRCAQDDGIGDSCPLRLLAVDAVNTDDRATCCAPTCVDVRRAPKSTTHFVYYTSCVSCTRLPQQVTPRPALLQLPAPTAPSSPVIHRPPCWHVSSGATSSMAGGG